MHTDSADLSPLLYPYLLGVVIVAIGIAIMLPIHYSKVRSGAIPQASNLSALAVVGFVLAFLVPLGGVICSHISLSQIKKTRARGWGFAVAGLWIGYANLVLDILVILALILLAVLLPVFIGNIEHLVNGLH